MTKGLRDYITEAEAYITRPAHGDEFDIEIAPGDVISTYVLESTEDSVTVYGDETMMSLLETIRRYGAVGSNPAMGYSLEEASLSDLDVERQDYERMTPAEFQRAYGRSKDEWQAEYDQMFNRLQGQTRKAMQRTQKKDPDYCDACDRPNNRCVCESLVQEAQAVSATTVADAIFRAIKRDYADQGFTWPGDIYDFWEFLDEYEGSRFVDQYWALSQRDQRAVFAAVKQAIKQHFSSGDDVADARGRGLMTRMREQGVAEGQTRKAMQRTQKKDPDYCDACDRPNNRCVCEGLSEGLEQRFMIYFVVPDVEDYDDHHEPEERTIIVASNRSEAIKKFQAEMPGAYIKDMYPIEGQQDVQEDQFFQRVLELAGCGRRMAEEVDTTDPLAAKAAALAPVSAQGSDPEVNIDEGVMKGIAAELGEIADTGDYDALYDLMTSTSPAGKIVQDIADEISINHRLHDDDHEELLELVMDRLIDDFGGDDLDEAEYQGRKVELNKPMAGDVKKSKVYVKDPKTGNVKKVNFGDKTMRIKKSNPARRKNFRARHNCDNPGPKTKARYWSCRAW